MVLNCETRNSPCRFLCHRDEPGDTVYLLYHTVPECCTICLDVRRVHWGSSFYEWCGSSKRQPMSPAPSEINKYTTGFILQIFVITIPEYLFEHCICLYLMWCKYFSFLHYENKYSSVKLEHQKTMTTEIWITSNLGYATYCIVKNDNLV